MYNLLNILKRLLTENCEYWVIRKTYFDDEPDSILMVALPYHIKIDRNPDKITLPILQQLLNANLPNVFLNNDFPPFQANQTLQQNVIDVFPIKCNEKEFLTKALQLNSNDFQNYVELALKLTNEKKA